ncbi:MAG: lysostaphin resistance A-like protein [Aureispira sp.]
MESNNLESTPLNISFLQLLSFVFIWLCCALVGSLILTSFMQGSGLTSMEEILEQIKTTQNGDFMNQLRYFQIVGHLSNYFLPGVLFIFWWHRKQPWKKMYLDQAPTWKNLLASFAAILVLFPFVSWIYYWNMELLPTDWIALDKLELQMAFLNMRNSYELFLNIFLLGVVAAVGEELVFRGIIQRIVERLVGNVHGGAFITAALFSFIHFQWEGFVARFILGLLFCYLLIYTRNLWVPILMHFFFNSIQVIIPYFSPESIKQVGETTEVPIVIAIISILLFSIIWKLFILNKNIIYK